MHASNRKLRDRAVRFVMAATGAARETAEAALAEAGGVTKTALVMLLTGCSAQEAQESLNRAGGIVRKAAEESRQA